MKLLLLMFAISFVFAAPIPTEREAVINMNRALTEHIAKVRELGGLEGSPRVADWLGKAETASATVLKITSAGTEATWKADRKLISKTLDTYPIGPSATALPETRRMIEDGKFPLRLSGALALVCESLTKLEARLFYGVI